MLDSTSNLMKPKFGSGNSVVNDNYIQLKETDSKFTFFINLICNTSQYNNYNLTCTMQFI